MERNYNQCRFKVALPKVEKQEDCHIVFQVMGKADQEEVELIVENIYLKDKLGNSLITQKVGDLLQVKNSNFRQRVSVKIPKEGENIVKADYVLGISFIDKGKEERITVIYLFEGKGEGQLGGIERKVISEQELLDYRDKMNTIEERLIIDNKYRINHERVYSDNINREGHPILEKYRNFLTKEIHYLQTNGGRQYKVVNGKLMSKQQGEYAYVFEMETELYLSDAAPVKVRYQGKEVDGEVLLCEDFTLTVILKQNIGDSLLVAYITVAPWKLLKALEEKISALNNWEQHEIARKLIMEGPLLGESYDINNIKKGQNEAIKHGINEPITIIWGPPGTGKTYTMSQMALYFQKKGKKVLIVSQSNVSVDGVIKKIIERLEEENETDLLKQGKVLRYGYVRDETLARHEWGTSFNYCMKKFPELAARYNDLIEEKEQLKLKGRMQSEYRIELEKKIRALRLIMREKEKQVVEDTDIIATTISKVAVDKIFDEKSYDVVMFDEVSMAYIPQIFMAAGMARKHFICVGDFRQLPCIAQSEAKVDLEEDIFSYLEIVDHYGNIKNHPWLVMLHIQRRMHPRIAAFSSHFIYKDLLKSERKSAEKVQVITNRYPFEEQALIHFDLTGTYCAADKNSDHSRFNLLSALIAFQTAVDCEKREGHKVGIITPYGAQMRLIRAMIEDYKKKHSTKIICSTVHQFQGSERDIIIFDAIESYPLKNPGILLSKDEKQYVTRLINVAVTRAKGKLITIGHNRFWENKLKNKAHPLNKLLKYEEKFAKTLRHQQLTDYLKSISYGDVQFWEDNTYLEDLCKDIIEARECIKVVMPSGQLKDGHSTVEEAIRIVIAKGIRLQILCQECESLPGIWKKLGRQSEKAIFPVIIIDSKKLWYGVPESRTYFKDGNSGYLTITPIVGRFVGKHTVDLIKSLMQIDEVTKSMGIAEEQYVISETGHQELGLAHFIKSQYRCSVCKEPLILKKGRSNKSYIGCSKCNHTEYLTPDLVNHYIMVKQIVCKKHPEQSLKARLGQYGVYIQCGSGRESHFLKPEQI